MLTALRQLASADFIALVHWIAPDVIELTGCDPALTPPQAFYVPAAWLASDVPVLLEERYPRRLLPTAIALALRTAPTMTCVVHGRRDTGGQPDSSLLLVWSDPARVPTVVREHPDVLQQMLVGRAPAEQLALPAAVARLDAIMAHVPQGVVFIDNSRGDVIVNAAASGWLDTSSGVVTARTLSGAMDRLVGRLRSAEFVRQEVARINADPDARIDDWTWELDDGSGKTLRVMSVPIAGEAGHGRLWTFDDVSHERALLRELAQHRVIEEKLRQVQKLEIVGRLAASVAHDFNNLLTIIGGSAEMLEDLPLDADRRADLQNIGLATDRARRLTRQLLTFTRQQVEQGEAFVLDERLRETAPLLRKVIAPHRTLTLTLQAGRAQVFADPNQVEHALLNLLANARDATSDGGTITLHTTVERLSGERVLGSPAALSGSHVAIAVHDTGIGFDDATRAQIFEPFFTTKPPGQGTGLGLATTLSIAERAGGGVRCSSVPGVGSTFTLLLPCANTIDVAQPPAAATTPGTSAPLHRVLLVDDDPGPRDTLRRLLVHEGFHVEVAESGASALRLLDAHGASISILVTDYVMPQMSGRELLEQVRMRLPQLPAIVISGYAPDRGTAATLSRLHAGFLAKPFTGRQLAEVIRQQLAAAAAGASS
ncbi:MAG: ATP-binding protein [Gemmatimonadota bacterium]